MHVSAYVCMYVCMFVCNVRTEAYVCIYIVIAYFVGQLIRREARTDASSCIRLSGRFSTTVTNVRKFYSCQM
jgi:hypothetical protein